LAAIIKQSDARTSAATAMATGTIVMYTNVEFPFKLSSAVFTYASRSDFTTGPAVIQTSLLSGGTCNDVSAQPCEQEWKFVLNGTSPPLCTFTGDWNLTFTVVCQTNEASTCSLPSGSPTTYTIPFHLTTESFCPVVFADVRLTASLASFQEEAHTTLKSSFLSGATSYYVATVTSPDALIVETKLHAASSNGVTLYDVDSFFTDSVFTVKNWPRNGTIASDHPTQSWFSILLSSAKFPVNVDSSAQFTIAVTLDVVFANTQSNGFRRIFMLVNPSLIKPHLLAAGDGANGVADAHAQVGLSNGNGGNPDHVSSGTSAAASLALIVGLALLQLIV
jgi:hypothetical protein